MEASQGGQARTAGALADGEVTERDGVLLCRLGGLVYVWAGPGNADIEMRTAADPGGELAYGPVLGYVSTVRHQDGLAIAFQADEFLRHCQDITRMAAEAGPPPFPDDAEAPAPALGARITALMHDFYTALGAALERDLGPEDLVKLFGAVQTEARHMLEEIGQSSGHGGGVLGGLVLMRDVERVLVTQWGWVDVVPGSAKAIPDAEGTTAWLSFAQRNGPKGKLALVPLADLCAIQVADEAKIQVPEDGTEDQDDDVAEQFVAALAKEEYEHARQGEDHMPPWDEVVPNERTGGDPRAGYRNRARAYLGALPALAAIFEKSG